MKNTFILDFNDTDSSIEFNIHSITVLDKLTGSINISSNEYVPADDQKLYFMPAVNIPRVKLKDLYSKYKIKTVRNIEDATHIFAGQNTYSKLVTNSWYYNLSKDAVEKLYTFFEETNVDGYYLNKLRIALDACETEKVYFYHSIRGIIVNSKHPAFVKFREEVSEYEKVPGSHYVYRIDDDYKEESSQMAYFGNIRNLNSIIKNTIFDVIKKNKKSSTSLLKHLGNLTELKDLIKNHRIEEIIQTKSDLTKADTGKWGKWKEAGLYWWEYRPIDWVLLLIALALLTMHRFVTVIQQKGVAI